MTSQHWLYLSALQRYQTEKEPLHFPVLLVTFKVTFLHFVALGPHTGAH